MFLLFTLTYGLFGSIVLLSLSVMSIAIPKSQVFSGIFGHYWVFLNMAYSEHIIKRAIELKKVRPASKVLDILKRDFPEEDLTSLDERTILRWVRTKSGLFKPSVQVEKERDIIPSNLSDNWKEHNEKLFGVANKFLENDLNRVMKFITSTGECKYLLHEDNKVDEIPERLSENDLSFQLEQNLISAYHVYTEWFYKTCFIPHLFAELTEEVRLKWEKNLLYEQPYELIDTLRLLVARKTFKGTCPICEDWR